jgi:hypothetical protein
MSWRITPTSTTWAEGGDLVYTIVVSGTTYRVHEFKTVGTTSLNVMSGGNVDYLVVAGGGVQPLQVAVILYLQLLQQLEVAEAVGQLRAPLK